MAVMAPILLLISVASAQSLASIYCFPGPASSITYEDTLAAISAACSADESVPTSTLIQPQYGITTTYMSLVTYTYNSSDGQILLAVAASQSSSSCGGPHILSGDTCTAAMTSLIGGGSQCGIIGGVGVQGCLGFLIEPNPTLFVQIEDLRVWTLM
jgi:hypothetical protein